MLEKEYKGYGYNEPNHFVPLSWQCGAEYDTEKNIKANKDVDGKLFIQEDTLQPDLLVQTCGRGTKITEAPTGNITKEEVQRV
jgi:hypothetical protein|nr:MAG TPA: hypothetical protein [Ackermannviridae sp.]